MLITMVLLPLMNFGLLPAMPLIWVLPYVGLLLMLLLLSVAQADRVNALRRRAERAQAALERNEARLTELVAERTRELAVAARPRRGRQPQQDPVPGQHEPRPAHAAERGARRRDLLRRSPRLGRDEQAHCGLIQRGGRHLLRLIDDLLDIARIEHDRLRPQLARAGPLRDADRPGRRDPPPGRGQGAGLRGPARGRPARAGAHRRSPAAPGAAEPARQRRQVHRRRSRRPDSAAPSPRQPAATPPRCCGSVPSATPAAASPRRIASACSPRSSRYHQGQPGSGLGLAICRELAAVLGGTLSSTATRAAAAAFAFGCPCSPCRAPPTATSRGRPDQSATQGPRRRILVIDDNARTGSSWPGCCTRSALPPTPRPAPRRPWPSPGAGRRTW
jgi:hypothetical protein